MHCVSDETDTQWRLTDSSCPIRRVQEVGEPPLIGQMQKLNRPLVVSVDRLSLIGSPQGENHFYSDLATPTDKIASKLRAIWRGASWES